MSQIKQKAQAYIYNYSCDECEKIPNPGYALIKQPLVLASYPPLYLYKCPNCDKAYNLSEIYPYVDFEPINEWP